MADLTVTKANRRDRKSTQQTVRKASPHICTKVWKANLQQIYREANPHQKVREAKPHKKVREANPQQIFRDR